MVGTIDYLIYTAIYFPTGVVDSLISSYLYLHENQNLINRKSIKFFRSLLRNKYSTAEAEFIELDGNQHNQPPRPVSAFVS